jgi:uncharacterized protein YkwD
MYTLTLLLSTFYLLASSAQPDRVYKCRARQYSAIKSSYTEQTNKNKQINQMDITSTGPLTKIPPVVVVPPITNNPQKAATTVPQVSRNQTQSNPVISTGGNLNAFHSECLQTHNSKRKQEGKSEFGWDPALVASAQKHANFIATLNKLQHSGDKSFGENLFMGDTSFFSSCKLVSDSWYNEKNLYQGQPIPLGNFHGYGHYTQMMWKSSTKLGCAFATGFGQTFTVCHYSPPGNVMGRTLAAS